MTHFSFPKESLTGSEITTTDEEVSDGNTMKKYYKISMQIENFNDEISGEECDNYRIEKYSSCVNKGTVHDF